MSSYVRQLDELISDLVKKYDACCQTDAKHATYLDGQIAGLEEAKRLYADFGGF